MEVKLRKILLRMSKMGIYVLILIQSVTMVLATESDAQRRSLSEITIDLGQQEASSLIDLVEVIESKSNFTFAYLERSLKKREIHLKQSYWHMDELLKEISIQARVSLRRVNESIAIINAESNDHLPDLIEKVDVQQTITGTVKDESGQPLPGATVLEKGTTNGTTTDISGKFQLSASEDAVLIVSFVGYETQEILVNNRSVIDIELNLDSEQLEEVVVVGYGKQDKRDLTGAVASVKEDDLKAFPITSAERGLQGRVAGVQVTSNSGQPGGGVTVRIRGVGTVNNNSPLYVIDGVPIFSNPQASNGSLRPGELQNPLSMINPNDIESIEILKDASATAIYGSRANNGVVMITTKKGKEGALKVNFESFWGINNMNAKYNQMEAKEWSQFSKSLLLNSGFTNDVLLPALDEIINDPNTTNYDWVGEAVRNGAVRNYQIDLSGGNKTSRYFISGNYYDEVGTVIKSGFERYSLRINTDHTISDKISIGNTLTISRTDQLLAPTGNNNGSIFLSLNRMTPVRPIYNETGGYAAGGDFQTNQHTIADLQSNKETLLTSRVLGSIYGEYKILPLLSFNTSWSVDQIYATQELFQPPYDVEGSAASKVNTIATLNTDNRQSFSWFGDNYFSFKPNINQKHSLAITAGISAQKTSNKNYQASVSSFINGNLPYLSAGINQGTVAGNEVRNALFSYFGRVNYSFQDKYLLTATLRRDGSSRFGKDNQFGAFPAISLGWRLSEEEFLQNSDLFSDLKLRTSWGKSGGQEIGDYTAYSILGTNYNYIFNDGHQVGGVAPLSLANPALQWEETIQTNIGIDAGFLDGRISLSGDYYIKNTTKLLLPILTPLEQGAVQTPFANQGEISNKGFELGLSTVNIDNKFRWLTEANFSSVKNEVISLSNNDAPRLTDVGNANFSSPTYITQIGDPIGRFLLYDAIGIFQTWDEIYNAPRQNTPVDVNGNPTLPQTNTTQQTSPGDIRFRDVDGNGVINTNDRVVVGNTIPDFTWGITNDFRYKGIGLSVFFMGVHGVNVYNGLRSSQERMTSVVANYSKDVLNAWTESNTDTDVPRAIQQDPNINNRASTRFLEDGSFVRLKNVRLSYDLPQEFISRIKVSFVQVYFSGVNLLTFTDYRGFDPELGNENQNAEVGNLDAGKYPVSKQFIGGIKIGF